MALTKETVIDHIEVIEGGHIQVRRAEYVLENGVRIAGPKYSRVSYLKGSNISSEDAKVQAVANAAWPLY